MTIRQLSKIFDADRIAKMFGQLPPEQQFILSQSATPEGWSSRINAALMGSAAKPANFESLPPSMQMQWALQQIVPAESAKFMPGATDRLTQLAAAAIDANRQETMSPFQKLHQLVAETQAEREKSRTEEFNANDLARTSLDVETLNRLVADKQ